MREITFRGKRKDNGEWVEGDLIQRRFQLGKFIEYFEAYKPRKHVLAQIEPETIGQYTGLKDKNGVKIFEGDIIRNHKGLLGRVTYMPEHCAFMIYITSENRYCYLWDNDFTKIEVIGNIYDNPELLEVQHENT